MTEKKKVSDYYAILGLEYTATKVEIGEKFQQIAEANNINFEDKESLTAEQKLIKEAYEVLYDEYVRLDYDVAYRKIMKGGGFEKYYDSAYQEARKAEQKTEPDVRSLYPQMENPNDRLQRLHAEATGGEKKKNKLVDQGVMIEMDTSNLGFNYNEKKSFFRKGLSVIIFVVVLILIPIFFYKDLGKQFENVTDSLGKAKNSLVSWFSSEVDSVFSEDAELNEVAEKKEPEVKSEKPPKKPKTKTKKSSPKKKTGKKKGEFTPKKRTLSTSQMSKKAKQYLENEEYSKAIDYYEKLAKRHDKVCEANMALGDVYYKQEKPLEAVKYYTKAIAKNKKFDALYVKRCFAYLFAKRYSKAIDDIKTAIELNQYNEQYQKIACELFNEYAEYQISTKDYKEALISLKRSRYYDKDNEETYFNLGRVMYYTNQLQEAIEMYKKVINLNPEHERVGYHLALAYLDYGRYFRGKENYTKSLQYLKLVEKTDDTGKLKANHDLALTYTAVGRYQLDKKERQKAVTYLNKALTFDKEVNETYYLLGKAYYDLDKYKLSKKNLLQAKAMGHERAALFYNENIEDFAEESN